MADRVFTALTPNDSAHRWRSLPELQIVARRRGAAIRCSAWFNRGIPISNSLTINPSMVESVVVKAIGVLVILWSGDVIRLSLGQVGEL